MKTRSKTLLLALCCALLLSSVVYAATRTKTLTAYYNDIQLVVDGVSITPKDANGTVVEPFIVDGTTYLPVRAVGEALGKTVDWDGRSHTVYVGEKLGDMLYFIDRCPAYQYDSYRYNEYSIKNGKFFKMGGQSYTNGFVVNPYNGVKVTSLYNLNGCYDSLSFLAGHIDGTTSSEITVSFYLDGKLEKRWAVDPNALPESYSIDLKGALQLKIVIYQTDGHWGDTTAVGFANMILE